MDSDILFDGLDKTYDKKVDAIIKSQGLISMNSDKKNKKNK